MPPFDPYHQWLGIPAVEQAPNQCRLLGVPLLESDTEVTEAAGISNGLVLPVFLRMLEGSQILRAIRWQVS